MKVRTLWLLLGMICLLGCGSPQDEPLTIAAAASTHYMMQDLATVFEGETGIKVNVTTGASGQLSAQILNGAPFDLFFSADDEYPRKLAEKGMVAEGPLASGQGHLVLWSMKGLDFYSDMRGLNGPKISRIAIANPETAPYGRLSKTALQVAELWDSIQPKLVFAENISQVNNWVSTKAVDVGFTSLSTMKSGPFANKGWYVMVGGTCSEPLAQDVVLLQYGATHHAAACKRFWEFLSTPTAEAIFALHGY